MKVCLSCDWRFEATGWLCPKCGHAPPSDRDIPLFSPALSRRAGGFKAEYFGNLAALEAGHFWFRNRNRLLNWALATYFPDAKRFMEVGCGTGFVLSGVKEAFPNLEVEGSELFLEGLTFARRRLPSVPLYQMDGLHIPFEAEYDVVGAFDVLEHIQEDEAAMGQLFRAVKPAGGLLLTVPQHPSLWSEADVKACHARRYTRQELVQKVESAGFQTLRVTSFVTLLLPLMWLSRRRKHQDANGNAKGEFQMNPVLNGFLEAILCVETQLIRSGTNLTAGGSLLLVAKKPRVPAQKMHVPGCSMASQPMDTV
jgi:SAM-dependent methyltransferase